MRLGPDPEGLGSPSRFYKQENDQMHFFGTLPGVWKEVDYRRGRSVEGRQVRGLFVKY